MEFPSTLLGLILAVGPLSVSAWQEDTLRRIGDLREKDFGHNYPRHGLNLLYWFAHDFISFDDNNNMQTTKDPKSGAFGFHYYENPENLLPSLGNLKDYSYYIVGNLFGNENTVEAEKLPDYVTAEYLSSQKLDSRDQNNRDRIIVRRMSPSRIDQVYITQHYNLYTNPRNQYDPNNTHHISPELLQDIQKMERQDFLKLFNTRTKGHYAKCHPDRLEEKLDKYCDHKFSEESKASPVLSAHTLFGICCAAIWLILACC